MSTLANTDNIQAWSDFQPTMVAAVGEEGDAARRYVLNPVLFELFGELAGKAVLDAGCGTGYLARMCAKRGAYVTGIEPAPALYAYCVEREQAEPLGIRYIQADLSNRLPLTTSFDLVVANMVLMDIPDYQPAIRHCIAALKPGGQFVFSLVHPCFDEVPRSDVLQGYRAKGYIRIEEYFQEFVIPQQVGYSIHRPLSAYLNLVIAAGCSIQRVVEPTLTAEGVAALGENQRDLYVPNFMVISATKCVPPASREVAHVSIT
jgi:SAM-dependent methyltransferase